MFSGIALGRSWDLHSLSGAPSACTTFGQPLHLLALPTRGRKGAIKDSVYNIDCSHSEMKSALACEACMCKKVNESTRETAKNLVVLTAAWQADFPSFKINYMA